jgi:cysteine-rich repeat protein
MRMSSLSVVLVALHLGACGSVVSSSDDVDEDTGLDSGDGPADDGAAPPDVEPDAPLDAETGPDVHPDADAAPDIDAAAETDAVPDVLPDLEAEAVDTTTHECGNARVEAPDEECDDGNEIPGDGCETDCTFSCHAATDCPDDGNPCTTELCADVVGGRACRTELNTLSCDDSDPCTSSDRCAAGLCAGSPLPVWYRDADGDRYGDPAITACALLAPSGYVANDLDCCDLDNQVRPDQTAWFDAPSAACAALAVGGFWDYDCSGLVERRDTLCGACVASGTSCAAVPAGWAPGGDGTCAVACGVEASWIASCRRESSSCLPNFTTSRQRCR